MVQEKGSRCEDEFLGAVIGQRWAMVAARCRGSGTLGPLLPFAAGLGLARDAGQLLEGAGHVQHVQVCVIVHGQGNGGVPRQNLRDLRVNPPWLPAG